MRKKFSSTMLGTKALLLFSFKNKIVARLCHTRYRRKPIHGTRFLLDRNRVFKFNAWDNVQWDEEQEAEAKRKVEANSQVKLNAEEVQRYESDAGKYWDSFYGVHSNRFFKDRHWLFTEFPELNFDGNNRRKNVLEIGCGVGNTVFPILQYSKHADVFVYCCDFSQQAINILKENPDYDATKCNAFVLDVTEDQWTVPFPENSLDVVVLIFVLSAIHPDKLKHISKQLHKYLKPGGLLLFRDYGRYDMAQLRFKAGRCLAENFYVRGDGTRVYFFTQEEVQEMFESAGLVKEEIHIDRRLQVNRGRMLKMYRIWIQAKYRKPL